jgi:hypothetical protein
MPSDPRNCNKTDTFDEMSSALEKMVGVFTILVGEEGGRFILPMLHWQAVAMCLASGMTKADLAAALDAAAQAHMNEEAKHQAGRES